MIIALFVSAIAGIMLANIIIYADEKRDKRKKKEREKRKKLGKKWYDD